MSDERRDETGPEAPDPGGRHAGREVALQVLYALDLAESGPRAAREARIAREAATPTPPPAARPRPSSAGPLLSPRARARQLELEAERAAEAQRQASLQEAVAEAEDVLAAETLDAIDPVKASEIAFERITEHFSVPGSAIAFARLLVSGVAARVADLDELVGQHARNWRVSRMAAVDRNVLRLAVFELRDTQTPVAVVIDEAVDLARRFGSDTSPSFVNGVLDAVAREVRAA